MRSRIFEGPLPLTGKKQVFNHKTTVLDYTVKKEGFHPCDEPDCLHCDLCGSAPEDCTCRPKQQERLEEYLRNQNIVLPGVNPVIYPPSVFRRPEACRFKGCERVTILFHSKLCVSHFNEQLRLEGGAGIAPKFRYVTRAEPRMDPIVTCDVGADWED